MMDNKENNGEHSKKSRDGNEDDERPFKKARYVWQLKGKYHLKDTITKPRTYDEEKLIKAPNQTQTSDSDSDDETYIKKSNNCNERCIDTLLTHSDALLDNYESDPELSSNIEKSISDDIPVTLVKSVNKNQDEFLHKWQARQVAKSFVDNTINSILEHWKIAPFDATDFVENCENGEQVEDEGIMMAIQSHGLQPGMGYNPSGNRYLCQTYRSNQFDIMENDILSIVETSNESRSEDTNKENDSVQMDDPMDFLNAAVSVAIQKKGLSSCNFS